MFTPRDLAGKLYNKKPYLLLETLVSQAGNCPDYSWIFAEPAMVLRGNINNHADLHMLSNQSTRHALAGAVAYDGEFTLGVFKQWGCWDQEKISWCEGEDWVEGLANKYASCSSRQPAPEKLQLQPCWNKESFIAAVQQAKEHIARGDIYQINLSQAFASSCLDQSHFELYRQLAANSPAPLAGHMQFGDFEIISSSPELFLAFDGKEVITKPIKGTRPRADDCEQDLQLQRELLESSKERAELVMITDLLRNDLGQFCHYGSVKVEKLCALESFSQVHHMVSTIHGHMRPDYDCWSALQACFPGGSITGAPKCMAMRLIEQLEPSPRGYYTGCMGFSLPDGRAKFNILIRSLIRQGTNMSYHVGAGIVADSDAEAEYLETLAKAKGIRMALDALAEVSPD